VIIFTVVDKVEGKGKIAKLWHERFSAFNDHVRVVASKYPTILFEGKKAEFLNTQSFLSSDRLHMNSEGHRRLANAVLEGLGYEFDPNWQSNIPLDNGKIITIKPLTRPITPVIKAAIKPLNKKVKKILRLSLLQSHFQKRAGCAFFTLVHGGYRVPCASTNQISLNWNTPNK
jgi:hypothetical protein